MKGKEALTTQIFVKGHPQNKRDGIFNEVPASKRDTVAIDFAALEGSTVGELQAKFDIVLGKTKKFD